MALPRVLAGPIVRRVEPAGCSFWLALSEQATVTARVWLGEKSAPVPDTDAPLAEAQLATRAIGTGLHVVVVTKDEIRPSLSFTGRVQAQDKVELRARVEGFLEKRLFNEGQDVKEGDLLFVIEQAPYKASIDEIEASIQKAQAALKLADAEVERQSTLRNREVRALLASDWDATAPGRRDRQAERRAR